MSLNQAERNDLVLVGMFGASGVITISKKEGRRYRVEASVTVRTSRRVLLDPFVTRFKGEIRSAPFGQRGLVRWITRSCGSIHSLCTLLLTHRDILGDQLVTELELIEEFVRIDARGRRIKGDMFVTDELAAERSGLYARYLKLRSGHEEVWSATVEE